MLTDLGLSLQTFLWTTNIFVIMVPVSIVAAEWFRTKKPDEGILLIILMGLGLLEFSVHFLFSWTPDTRGYMAYRIINGIFFASVCWLLLYKDIGDDRVFFQWMRASNIIITLGAILVFLINAKSPLLASRAFFVWEVVTICCVGYITIREKERDLAFMLIVMFLWIFSHSIHFAFSTVFYAALSILILTDKIRDVMLLDSMNKQLMREKETTFKLINDISTSVRDITRSDETINLILNSAMETTHADAGAIYLYEESSTSSTRVLKAQAIQGPFIPLHTMHGHEQLKHEDSDYVDKFIRDQEIKIGQGIIGSVAEAGTSILIEDAESDVRIKRLGGGALNIRTLVAVPIKIKSELLGVLVCINKADDQSFSLDDRSVLQALADQAALSINNARLYASLSEQERIQRELEIATEIQMGLLPETIPIVNGINISAVMKTAREVGGDYYDCIKLDEDRMGIVIGDVAGKGVPAGMIMLIVRTILHILAHQFHSAKEVITGLSDRIYPQMDSRQFMTFLFFIWDNKRRVMQYASAGHEHILHYRRKPKSVNRIRSGGVAIGMHPEIDQFVTEKEIKIDQGDMIVLYTDGITEAKTADGDMYGLNRLQNLLEQYPDKAPDEIKKIVFRDITKFTGNVEQYDDMTLVITKFI